MVGAFFFWLVFVRRGEGTVHIIIYFIISYNIGVNGFGQIQPCFIFSFLYYDMIYDIVMICIKYIVLGYTII